MTTKNGVILTTLAIAGFWIAGQVQAFNPQPDPPGKFGLVGIIASQTARLDAVAIHEVEKACMVEMSILDIDGNVLASARHELRRGKGVFLDLPGTAALTGRAGPRAEIRGLVKLLLGGPGYERLFDRTHVPDLRQWHGQERPEHLRLSRGRHRRSQSVDSRSTDIARSPQGYEPKLCRSQLAALYAWSKSLDSASEKMGQANSQYANINLTPGPVAKGGLKLQSLV